MMYERLQDLAREAGHYEFNKWDYFDIEKFAKLIVKECAKVNYNSPFKDGEFHARELLEHFGVEE